jgi:hypothetical protein
MSKTLDRAALAIYDKTIDLPAPERLRRSVSRPAFCLPLLRISMRSLPVRTCLGALFGVALMLSTSTVRAQLNNGNQWPVPRLNFVSPLGGKPGTTVEVTFGGVDCEQPESLWFSHLGIKGTPVIPESPKVDPKKEPKKGRRDGKRDGKKDPQAITKFNVAIDKAVLPGHYDVRLVNSKGISNPRVFVVSGGEEVAEKEPNNEPEQAQKVAVGQTVSGAISAPTDVDYFEFTAKAGQRILFHAATASLDSKLYPEMRIFDAAGHQIAYSRPLPYQDGLLDFTVPADAAYWLRLNQFTYTTGGTDFFYRLHVGAGPWIDAIDPPVVPAGKPTQVTVYGRNLPGGVKDPAAVVDGVTLEKVTVTVNAPADPQKLEFFESITPWQASLNGFEYRLGASNPKFLEFSQAPIVIENDDNDTPEKAQKVTVPCEIAGRIDKLRDRDWYAFDAKKGDVLVIDAASARLGAPTDLYFKLVNPANKQATIVMQDDNPETVTPRAFYTASRDPAPFRFVVPADGTYQLLVGSHVADIAFGPQHNYRLRIAPETHDFRLIAMPPEDFRSDTFVIGKSGQQFLNIYAIRQDGFKGDIEIKVEGLPKGLSAVPQVVGGHDKHAMLVIHAGDDAPEKYEGAIKITGTATIAGKKVTHDARPASVTWGIQSPQNNSPAITRIDRSFMIAVRGKAPVNVTAAKDKYLVMSGDKVVIPLKMVRHDPEFKGNFQITPVQTELPPGINFGALTFAPGKDEQTLTLTTQPNQTPMGRHNIVVRGFAPMVPHGAAKGKTVNAIFPVAPIELTVVPKQVASSLALEGNNATLHPGKETVLTFKLNRLHDYGETFQVTVLSDSAKDAKNTAIKGVAVAPVTLEAGKSDVKLTFKTAADAMPGPRNNLTLRAVAVISGVTLNHDLKFNANVVAEPKKK